MTDPTANVIKLTPSPQPIAATAPALGGRPLGEILVLQAGLAPEKVEEALASQRGEHAGQRLGEILVRMKALSEEDVLRALATQLDLPYLARVDAEEPSAELARKIP